MNASNSVDKQQDFMTKICNYKLYCNNFDKRIIFNDKALKKY